MLASLPMAFKVCSSCRHSIDFGDIYWVCSVSTCNRKRTGLYFCSVACWEAHLPSMRHREAWAVEKRAPSEAEYERMRREEEAAEAAEAAAEASAARTEAAPAPEAPRRVASVGADSGGEGDLPRDVLIVVSKLKKYIKARSGFNTSDSVMSVLSDHVREVCDRAIRHAGQDGRKTVLDRDFKAIL
jgi:hypothetical protein